MTYKIQKVSEMYNVPKSSTARLVLKNIKPEAKIGAQLMSLNQAKNNQTANMAYIKQSKTEKYVPK